VGFLTREVWRSALPGNLKPLAACMVGLPSREGAEIFASVAYLAWLLDLDRSTVQRQLSKLRALKIIERASTGQGGRGHGSRYQFNLANLPRRASWAEERAARMRPFDEIKGRIDDAKGPHGCTERAARARPYVLRDGSLDVSPHRKRNKIARSHEDERKAPSRFLEAIKLVDFLMRHEAITFDEAIARLDARPEFADRQRGDNFLGTVVYYFKTQRGLELAGKARA